MSPPMSAGSLIVQLKSIIQNPEALLDQDDARAEVVRLARQASVALESPSESVHRVMFAYLPLVTTCISNDFKIFATLAKGNAEKPVSLADLVKASGLNQSLVSSIMEYNVYHGAAKELERGLYAPTRLTHSLSDPKVDKTTTCFHEVVGPAYTKLHQVLKTGPDEAAQKTAFQVAHRTTKNFYDFLESNPEKHSVFYGFMAANHSVTAKWTDVVDFDAEFGKSTGEGQVAFVDVGGGDGSQSLEAQRVHKKGGRIILQDRPVVIEKAIAAREAGIETMDYDFFLEQPIKGAAVYFIQFVLLNWDDEDAVKILASQVPAMGPDSVLLLVDWAQEHRWERKGGPHEPDLWTSSTAIAAYSCHESKGRNSAAYGELMRRAGLVMEEVRYFTAAGQAVMIASKA